MSKVTVLVYGVLAYALFLGTFVYAVGFVGAVAVPGTIDDPPLSTGASGWAINLALLALFAVQHTVMARRGFKRWLTRHIPWASERSTFVLAATVALALLMWQWRAMPGMVWSVENGLGRGALWALFGLGWATVLVSTFLIDHFELFGVAQVVAHFRGRKVDPPPFRTPGLYRVVRHPIMVGFIVAFWATPEMSTGHLLFAAATTAYIVMGVVLEERDLVARFGDRYLEYRRRVRMLLPIPKRAVAAGATQAGCPGADR